MRRYAVRRGSGGAGKYRGGDGAIREIELLTDAQVALLSDRRKFGPYGLQGGAPGKRGRNSLIRAGRVTELPGKCALDCRAGDVVVIETPGGGAWGRNRKSKTETRKSEYKKGARR